MSTLGPLLDCLSGLGFHSITEYVNSQRDASLPELARTLGLVDVATMQLERGLVEEAYAGGEDAIERCARILVVRDLRNELRFWWPACPEESIAAVERKILDVFTSVTYALPIEYATHCERVRHAMEPALLAGWLPDDEEEPMLVSIFEQHWKGRTHAFVRGSGH